MSAIKKRLYYLWKKLAERQSRKNIAESYFKEYIQRYHTCTNRKPAAQIKREMKALHKYWNCFPFQYYRFDLFRKDCTLTLEEMKKYVPHFFLYHLFYPLSAKDYSILCQDKLLSYAALKAYEVRQPQLLLCFDNNKFYNAHNAPLSTEELNEFINASTAGKLFIKPRFGIGGKGILIFTKRENGYIDEQNNILGHSFFTDNLKNDFYIVQEGLVQHEEINRIYPGSVNTFRIVTECTDGVATILFAVLRMGSGGRQIDNSSAGGIFVKIDLDTGMLDEHAHAFNLSRYTAHPDTGFVFKGVTLQTWPDVQTFTIKVAQKFPEIKYIGWDIAAGQEGASVIEFNNKPDIAGLEECYGGARDQLNIKPDEWWLQSNYTIKNV